MTFADIVASNLEAVARVAKLRGTGNVDFHYVRDPKARWEREGSLPFDEWGPKVDGPGTPWEEWYDVPKLLDTLRPARFDLVFYTALQA